MSSLMVNPIAPTCQLTISIPDVDEVKADDVVTGVAVSRAGLVQAVDVKSGSENRPDAQHLEVPS